MTEREKLRLNGVDDETFDRIMRMYEEADEDVRYVIKWLCIIFAVMFGVTFGVPAICQWLGWL